MLDNINLELKEMVYLDVEWICVASDRNQGGML
jgi:hypothetical protein